MNHPGLRRRLVALALMLTLIASSADFSLAAPRISRLSAQAQLIPNQILVRYKPGRSAYARSAVAASGVRVKPRIPELNVDKITVPAGQDPATVLQQLRSNPDVESASMNGIYQAFDTPNDASFSSQYYLGTSYINAPQAWDVTQGSSTVVIAVLDTGVFLTHPDIANQLWTNPSPSGTSGLHGSTMEIDWNGNGNCTDIDPTYGPDQCASADPTDDQTSGYHGTHVSGIIAAETNNTINIAGVARNCKIMAVKVLNSEGTGNFDSIAAGIIYAANNGASVINMSLGGATNDPVITTAVDYAIARNVVIVAASGNSLTPPCGVNYPAAISQVIAVGATDSTNTLASFSCTGSQLDLVAPGVNILSLNPPASTSSEDGTSFSSPQVAGVAALIRSLSPNMSVSDVTRYIDFNARDLGPSGFDNSYGFGLLNAYAAVTAASGGTPFVSNPINSNETFPYPNPFNPNHSDHVTIALPSSMGSTGIKIEIRNLAGELVKTLNGTNSWNGRNDDGTLVASGLYFYYAKTSLGDTKGKLTVLH